MISFACRLKRARFTLDAAFEAPAGCVALFGASGSGKSTIARLIAGLERPDAGRIAVNGETLVDTASGIMLPAHRRRVGIVFQDGQLLPHLTVRQNLAYGRYFAPKGARAPSSAGVVDLLGVGHLMDALPATLSGGERQRVAIGRALLAAPRVLVMDEPLASLDIARKLEILPFIERLRDELSIPVVYISHAMEEVARLATTVVRLAEGRVVAQGSPAEVFAAVPSDDTADRFEAVSILSGTVLRERPEFGMTILGHPAGEITVPGRFGPPGRAVRLAVKATNITLALDQPVGLSVRTSLRGSIASITAGDGPSALAILDLDGGDKLSVAVTRLAIADLGLAPGKTLHALIKAVSIDERSVAMLGPGEASGQGDEIRKGGMVPRG